MKIPPPVVLWCAVGIAQAMGGLAYSADLVGRVIDVTGGPLHDTTIELRRDDDARIIRTFVTDLSGSFQFTDLASGSYQLSFNCPGFSQTKVTRTISQEERAVLPDLVLQLAPIVSCPYPDLGPPDIELSENDSGPAVTGHVEEQNGTPVRGATVILENQMRAYRTSSERSGSFQFSGIKPGVYLLRVQRGGFIDFIVDSVEIKDGYTSAITDPLRLPRCPGGVMCRPIRNTLRFRVCF